MVRAQSIAEQRTRGKGACWRIDVEGTTDEGTKPDKERKRQQQQTVARTQKTDVQNRGRRKTVSEAGRPNRFP